MKKNCYPLFKLALSAGATALLASPAYANNFWIGTTSDWNDGANWTTGAAPDSVFANGHYFVSGTANGATVSDTAIIPAGVHQSVWMHAGFNGSAGTVIQAAGSTVTNTAGYRFGRSTGSGTYVMNGDALTVRNEFNMGYNGGSGTHNFTQNSGTVTLTGGQNHFIGNNTNHPSTMTLNGGSFNITNSQRWLFVGNNANGTLTIGPGASLNSNKNIITGWGAPGGATIAGDIAVNDGQLNGTLLLLAGRGSSILDVTAGSVDLNTLRMGWTSDISTTGAQVATVNQTGGKVNIGTAQLSEFTTDGTYNLQGGTLGVNNLGIHTGATFNWGEATLSTDTNGAAGGDDYSSLGFTVVQSGQTMTVTGANADLITGHDFGGGVTSSTLDLGGLYINSGVRFNQMVTSGALDLSAAGDTLRSIDSPYPLRPNIGLAVESGSLLLVDAAGGITGEFDTFVEPFQDNIGWDEYTGVFTDAASLPVNSWYLEYTNNGGGADQILFHYKVEGTVPEPGTVGMLAIGLLFMRSMRDRLRRSN